MLEKVPSVEVAILAVIWLSMTGLYEQGGNSDDLHTEG